MRRKYKKRLPKREKKPLVIPSKFTQSWSIDSTSDVLDNGPELIAGLMTHWSK